MATAAYAALYAGAGGFLIQVLRKLAMHTYRKTAQGVFMVGFEVAGDNVPIFRPMRDFQSESKAAAFTSFLNGGAKSAAVELALMASAASQHDR